VSATPNADSTTITTAGYREVAIARPCTGEEEWQALRASIESGWLTQGPRVAEFESVFAERHRVRHAMAVPSGAAGAELQGRCAGSMGEAAAFSFHPRKTITTGEGGMVTTNDDDLAAKMRKMRDHGTAISEERRQIGPQPYLLPEFDEHGFNYRMTDLQGAVGVVQFAKLNRFIDERAAGARFYAEAMGDIPWLRLSTEPGNGRHAWQSYVTYVDESAAPAPRNEIMRGLLDRGVATRPSTHGVHMLAYDRRRYVLAVDDLPASRDCANYSMAIPLHNMMTRDDYEHVVACIRGL